MDEMGFQNEKAVYRLSGAGRLLKPRGGQVTVDPTALLLLAFMAHNAYDWPPTEEMRNRHVPCRCYSRGWDAAARAFGLTIAGGVKAEKILAEGGNLEGMMATRLHTARVRLSQAGKFLQKQGLIKLLAPADVRRERPATWLLLLGDDEENREVEAYARKCLGL